MAKFVLVRRIPFYVKLLYRFEWLARFKTRLIGKKIDKKKWKRNSGNNRKMGFQMYVGCMESECPINSGGMILK